MGVRYRILESHFDREGYLRSIKEAGDARRREVEEERAAAPSHWLFGKPDIEDNAVDHEVAQALSGLLDHPRRVEWRDGEATIFEVRVMVARGELHLRDLVDVGRGWEPVDACAELYEEAALLQDAQRKVGVERVWMGAAIALALLLAAGAVLAWHH